LLALEAADQEAAHPHLHEALRVCEKLRISLTKFVGEAGFAALMKRSLALAKADIPALQAVTATDDGTLEGLEAVLADRENGGDEGAEAITVHLLKLLVTFVGEPLALLFVREAWPDASLTL
jgi:hypothetical protein